MALLRRIWHRFFKKTTCVADEVFTPNEPATYTYVERKGVDEPLARALATTGKQIVVYGHSGSGKTTLLRHQLGAKYTRIVTSVMSHMTLSIVSSTGSTNWRPLEAEKTNTSSVSTSDKVGADLKVLRAQTSETTVHGEDVTIQRIVLPPATARRSLSTWVSGTCWVLEDFHKLPEIERRGLSQVMKIFMDFAAEYRSLKTIAIGAVGTAREVVALEPEMKNRVAEIEVPLMNGTELRSIIEKGQSLLNLRFEERVTDRLVEYSNGLAAVCHQLALNCCNAVGVLETSKEQVEIGEEELDKALRLYVEEESDTTKALFDMAMKPVRMVSTITEGSFSQLSRPSPSHWG